MNGAQAADTIWYVLALVLVGSALATRRFSLRNALGMVLGWIGVFLIVFILFSYRSELGMVADRVRSELTGQSQQRIEGKALHIQRSLDGHYWANGTINGTPARFLIDSGASVTGLSEETAIAAGLDIDSGGFPVIMQTANGRIQARRSSVARLEIGSIEARDLPVVVSPAFGNVNVIGMNLLSQLKSWRVEGGEMVMEP